MAVWSLSKLGKQIMESRTTAVNTTDAGLAAKGIWIFVAIDMAIFALFFLVFLIEKGSALALFAQSQQILDENFGFANTIVLITSSWLLVESLNNIASNSKKARWLLAGSIFLGFVFVVVKLVEYYLKFSAGISIVENTFFSFYFLLTFIHFCHVLAGLIALIFVFRVLGHSPGYNVRNFAESTGIYWHMVDLLWVFLFLLLYLLR